MLDFVTVRNKPLVQERRNTPSGDIEVEEYLDITTSSYKPLVDALSVRVRFMTVTPEQEMRPDLIAYFAYNDISLADLLMAFNNISNPFSITTGDIIMLPSRNDLIKILDASPQLSPFDVASPENRNDDSVRQKANTWASLREKTQEINKEVVRNKLKKFRNAVQNPLPPNFRNIDRGAIEPRDGRIIFGNDVSNTDCVTGLTDTEVKSRVIQKRIQKTLANLQSPINGTSRTPQGNVNI